MKLPALQGSKLALLAVIVPLVVLFIYVATSSGPLSAIKVTVTNVSERAIQPKLFGLGTVQARYTYKIGPTFPGRLQQLSVDVGDRVSAGQVIGTMDPVDLADKMRAQQAAIEGAESSIIKERARQQYAASQVLRYRQLKVDGDVSDEMLAAREQEATVAAAVLQAAIDNLHALQAQGDALVTQERHLQLVAPTAGLVIKRDIEPGSTVVAGQPVIEIIDPTSIWVDTRFDQINAEGLRADLSAAIQLRSRRSELLPGLVLRVEPTADALTEETLAKILFTSALEPLAPLGELAEVTIALERLAPSATIPNAALRNVSGQLGVWRVQHDQLDFVPLQLGASDLDGYVQVFGNVQVGDQVVVYSAKTLAVSSNIEIVEQLVGSQP